MVLYVACICAVFTFYVPRLCLMSGHFLGKSCSFGKSCVLFLLCHFGYFPFEFREQCFGSD